MLIRAIREIRVTNIRAQKIRVTKICFHTFALVQEDEIYMQRCFQLARLGMKHVKPNPMVGAVLVHNKRIIGEGYHEQFGLAHAEVNCIQNVTSADKYLIPESKMYVSLEPCIHFGKTPPCADLIIQSGIKKLIIACSDPFAKVNGGGIKKLQDAGINIVTPFLEKDAWELNKRFFTFHSRQRPYIILKWAQSNDNKIASMGQREQISNSITNALVHKWRSEEGAIIIGTNTATIDDPSLTTRHWPGPNPLRVVVDMNLRIPATAAIFADEEPLILLNAHLEKQEGKTTFFKCNRETMLQEIVSYLYRRNITSLIVEGGSILLQSFIDLGLWDEARVITNRSLTIPGGVQAPVLTDALENSNFEIANDEIRICKKGHTA